MAAAASGDWHARRADERETFLHVFCSGALRDGGRSYAVVAGRIQPGRREVAGIGRSQQFGAEGLGEGVEVGDLCSG